MITQKSIISSMDLKIGDVVRPVGFTGEWSTHTVIAATASTVRFHRPYVETSDFSYAYSFGTANSSGSESGERVIPMIGVEEYDTYRRTDDAFELLRRKDVK